MMNKKLIVNTFLLLALVSATTVFAHLGDKQLTVQNLLGVQPQRQFVIPQDYLILGGDAWMSMVQESDSQLSRLHAAATNLANENNTVVRDRYLHVLRQYFMVLCDDITAIDRFFEFSHLLSQVQKEYIADCLLTVVSEHNAFLSVPNYQADICAIFQYSDEDFEGICNNAISLEDRLSNMLPHEADDEMDIFEEQIG